MVFIKSGQELLMFLLTNPLMHLNLLLERR